MTDVVGSQDWVSGGVEEAGPRVMSVVFLSSDSRCSGELTLSSDITALSGACSQSGTAAFMGTLLGGNSLGYSPEIGLSCPPGVSTGTGWVLMGGTTLSSGRKAMIFRSALRFRQVIRPDPSTRTRYWLNGRDSTTLPVRSHLFAWMPCWFWIWTLFPASRSGRFRVCFCRDSSCLPNRTRIASSRFFHVSCQIGKICPCSKCNATWDRNAVLQSTAK